MVEVFGGEWDRCGTTREVTWECIEGSLGNELEWEFGCCLTLVFWGFYLLKTRCAVLK